jgi:hypothetical protein
MQGGLIDDLPAQDGLARLLLLLALASTLDGPVRCALEPALIIALLIQLPVPIADLLGLLEEPVLGGDSQRNDQHKENKDREEGELD